jgi:recombinational DNA repair protein RecR
MMTQVYLDFMKKYPELYFVMNSVISHLSGLSSDSITSVVYVLSTIVIPGL